MTTLLAVVMPACAEDLSLDRSAWHIRYSQGMPSQPSSAIEGWYFDFPHGGPCTSKYECPGVHYVTTPYRKWITANAVLALSFRIMTRGKVRFNYQLEPSNTCTSPATVRAILQRSDDDLYSANGRFWSNPVATVLAPGSFTMTIELRHGQWTNVEGQHDQAGFEALLRNIGHIGVTFGGGCFFGHGVNVTNGSARFLMNNMAIR